MLIEQNYLDVSYLVIVFSKLKGEQGELTIYRKSLIKKSKLQTNGGYLHKSYAGTLE
jgi:hypothetical protein